MKADFTQDEINTAFEALDEQLKNFPLTREETGLKEKVSAGEFMLMQQGPCSGSDPSEGDWYGFKHRLTRNYVYVRVKDGRLWVPVNPAPHCFHRGTF